jgi:hypothetical protein
MKLAARITKLEQRIVPARAAVVMCEGCGQTVSGPGPPTYAMVFDEPGDPETPEFCGVCGRQLVYRLEFDRAG